MKLMFETQTAFKEVGRSINLAFVCFVMYILKSTNK